MNQQYRLLFVHGWGFSKDFWQPLACLLQDFSIHYIDLCFIKDQQTSINAIQTIIDHQDSYIAIGHSLGFIYSLKQFSLKFHHYIAINSFLRFSKADDFPSGISPRILQRMSKGIDKECHSVLSQFYQQCQYHQEQPIVVNNERLKVGLEWLGKDDLRSYLPYIKEKLTVLASDQDPIVLPEMTRDSFQDHPIHWIQDKTHLLPMTHPSLCATTIRNIAFKK